MTKMDKGTRAYFNNTAEKARITRLDTCSTATRRDLQKAFSSSQGKRMRIWLRAEDGQGFANAFKANEERAIAQCALWMQWKERQTGRMLTWGDIPPHAMPHYGAIKHDMPDLLETA